jgi:hypothetical protein
VKQIEATLTRDFCVAQYRATAGLARFSGMAMQVALR